VLVSAGALYCFESSGDEPLVMLRVGVASRSERYELVGPDDQHI